MNFIKILKSISKENRPFVIAEAGINHDGSLKKAFKMVAVAKSARANVLLLAMFAYAGSKGSSNSPKSKIWLPPPKDKPNIKLCFKSMVRR